MDITVTSEQLKSGIQIAAHKISVLPTLVDVIRFHFNLPECKYLDIDMPTYRHIMLQAQNRLAEIDAQILIFNAIYDDIVSYLGTDKVLIQNNIYLRASRPLSHPIEENIGWHREPFYGPNLEKSVNIWTPVRGVEPENTLRYIPESHKIPCDKISTKNISSPSTKQYSVGHKLGFNYSPKIIVAGVNLSSAMPMIVPENTSAIFPGMLIHGAAENNTARIRFSVDYQVIRKRDYSLNNKQFHYSSGKPYFREI